MSAPAWDTEWAAQKAADAMRWLAENYPECAGSEELHPHQDAAEDVSGGEFGTDKRETGESSAGPGRKHGEMCINTKNSEPRGADSKKASEVSEVSEEQERRIRKLVHEGMAEKSAQAAVLGKCPHGVPKGYPCDDCDVEARFGGAAGERGGAA